MRDTPSFKNEIPRSVALNKESIIAVDLHVFGDASIVVSCAVVYAVIPQPVTTQRLVAIKSSISKKKVTISRF